MPEEKDTSEQNELNALEAEMRDESAWEAIDAVGPRRSGLGSQVTIRLARDQTTRLRRLADEQGIGYTSLLRTWIGERLEAEDWALMQRTKMEWAGEGLTYTVPSSKKSMRIDVQTTLARRGVVIEAA